MADLKTCPPLTRASVVAAHDLVRPHVHRTPVLTNSTLSRLASTPRGDRPGDREASESETSGEVSGEEKSEGGKGKAEPARPVIRLWFKCENLQRVGAFKVRGAFHAVERLKAYNFHAGLLGIRLSIFMWANGTYIACSMTSLGLAMEQASRGAITLHVPKHGDDPSRLDFRDTSFFTSANSNLPSAADVLQRHAKDSRSPHGIAIFEELALVVKFGQPSHVHLENALTMRALWQAFPNREIPVPEVFGWRSEDNKNFIYMSLVPGKHLYEVWTTLSPSEKESICKDLGSIQGYLRRLRPESEETFIGSITRGEVRDRFARDNALDGRSGPFATIKDFNDWVQLGALPTTPLSQREYEDPYRPFLPDTGDVHFAHGDFHLGNIMVSNIPGSATVITGVIDWEEAGWYPPYWEYCKMALVIDEDHEVFAHGYIDSIMPQRCDNEMTAVGEYWSWRGYP